MKKMMTKLMKKIIFLAFSLLTFLFFSCNGLFNSVSDDSENEKLVLLYLLNQKNLNGANSNNQNYFTLSGSIKTQNSLFPSSSIFKSIAPAFPTSGLSYNVYAIKQGESSQIEASEVDSENASYSILIPSSGTYTFYAEAYESSDSSKIFYKGNTDALTVTNGKINGNSSEIDAITVKPFQTDSGSGKVAISVDVSGTEISNIKAEWKKLNSSDSSSYSTTEKNFVLHFTSDNSENSVSSGIYSLCLYFYSDSSSSIEVYRINEIVQVFDNLTTNTFSGNSSYFSGNSITLTSKIVNGTAYVCGTNSTTLKSSSSESGTYYAPFSSISDALAKVKASGSDTMTIYLDGTFTLSSALSLSLSDGETLNISCVNSSESAVLTKSSGNGIEISGGTVNLNHIKVKDCAGSGIYSASGNVNLESCEISGNGTSNPEKGGGIYCGGSVTIKDSSINNNKAKNGGGIYNSGTIVLSNKSTGLFSGNSASENGGGIYSSGSLTITDSTGIAGNSAVNGGGVYISGGTAEISGGTLSDNTASKNGGGLYNAGTLTISSETVEKNTAKSSGGGIYNEGDLTLRCAVINNSAETGGGIRTTEDISFSYSGATVSENYKTSDSTKKNNVVISSGKVFKLADTLQSGSKIGITLENALSSGESQVLTSGWKAHNASSDASSFFVSDDDGYSISTNSDGEVIIRKPATSGITHTAYTADGTNVIELTSSVTSFESGKTYLISDKTALSTLATLVKSGQSGGGSNFVLTANIDLESSCPDIGSLATNSFNGSFDGNNYCIYNLSASSGGDSLFKYLGDKNGIYSASVKNLRVKGTSTAYQYSGGIAANTYGSVTISNCISDVNFSPSDNGRYLGGIVGYINAGSVEIKNCVNNGTVTTQKSSDVNVAGFVGYITGTSTLNISNCVNNGNVSSSAVSNYVAGFSNGNTSAAVTITYCVNNGAITSSGTQVGAFTGDSYSTISSSMYYIPSGSSITAKHGDADSSATNLTDVLSFSSLSSSLATTMNSYIASDSSYVSWTTNTSGYPDLNLQIEDSN